MSELPKPELPQWAVERAKKVVGKLEDIGPGDLGVQFVALHFASVWEEGRVNGVEAAAAALEETFAKSRGETK